MMAVLNSRMVYSIENDTQAVSIPPIVTATPERFFDSESQAGVSVTPEQWSVTLDHRFEDLKMVSVSPASLYKP